jgi:Domain of unknown function (DUF6438)
MKRPLVLLALPLLAIACHPAWQGDGDHDTFFRPPGDSGGAGSTARSTSIEEPIPSPSPLESSTIAICLERTECSGSCPNYRVVIYGDGRVRYTGRSFVREVGEREGFLPENVVGELLERFDRVRFFDLRHVYEEPVPDLRTTLLSLRIGEEQNHVENRWMGDRFDRGVKDREIHLDLDGLADAIDAAVHIERWIGTKEERQQLYDGVPPGRPGSR